MASARKREASAVGTLQALGAQVLHIGALHVSCAAVLLMTMLVAGAAPSPSMAAGTLRYCPPPFWVNGPLAGPIKGQVDTTPVPGNLDLCTAWKEGKGLPQYQVVPKPRRWSSCEAFVTKRKKYGVELAKVLPDPGDLSKYLDWRGPYVTPEGLRDYRIEYTFRKPVFARIELYKPTWQDISESQKAFIDSLYKLVLVHEKGHQNIMSRLSQKFGHDEVHRVRPRGNETYGRAAHRLASTLFKQSFHGLVTDAGVIEAGAETFPGFLSYDVLTQGGDKQSVLGGKDYPSIEYDLCYPITSTFDSDDDRWTVVGDPESTVPDHHPSGGNPGGYVEVADDPNSEVWYWQAPRKYLGNKTHAYGRLLAFDLKQSALDRPFDNVDVRIAGGGVTLAKRFGSPPELDWTTYFLPLDTTGGWVDDATNAPATQEQIQSVLRSISLLHIRGEYQVGPDVGGLDSVAFGLKP